ncbi:SDR family NAD(P)-dependent oxidoreductase [Streptantibioticus cattleyicolor]|uniref:2,5-dichloro-2,5-cyclohexadiene-1,4-diol dehydrogenase n=1 Tax=Streptantibioticus cattleyicolor (strain ATCC 35852 / DSM 46488 / JCM 4925 / NBRC 14057 / NRRL 8057) TaxID=1003195 RepID=F8JKG9_STREN|nr:SDR family oxidoreductase [Streptantibioticus cattleyicolor]AEW99764.1 2,5-dichloro-2,5-cyclohexadiene-1,4-diol dehydrogenase [Streptantibioticus cattleyicolor NRRL 8057 = DSM 46488]CCB71198.1 2,5-dichloro-2,5-cyclohexadiene-1,4-diol dehydrogenase [Streptantibioticus cattleyicolor NRRL 8057 = DSM 46488]
MSGVSRKAGLVTGAGSGIGRATALELARGGAAVAVCDIDADTAAETTELIRKDGGDALAVTVDIADEDAVRAAVEATVTAFGGLDFAVNNAGLASHHRRLDEMTLAEFERVVQVNLAGTFLCMRYELPALRRRGGGAIVNIASNGGLYAIPTAPAYVAAKHGIVGLTKVAAVDYAPAGIRVNAVCPGPTLTPGFEKAVGTDMIAMQESITPLGRLATPEEAAAAAVWLCSDASSYVTGIALSVDGGRRA